MSEPQNKQKNGKRKANRGSIKPGETRNPGGRPKLPAEVKAELELIRGPLTLKAIRTLERNMDSADGMVSNVAAREWLKKTLPDGAVTLQLEVSGPEGGPVETKVVTLDDSPRSLANVASILAAAGVLNAGAGESPDAEADAVDSSEPH